MVCWFSPIQFLAQATPVTPSNHIWQDSKGNLYYQQPVKQVTTVDEVPVSIRVFESMPYVRIIKVGDSYELVPLSIAQFEQLKMDLYVVGQHFRSDFDGDGLPDLLIQTELGHELLVSNKMVKPFKIGIDLKNIGSSIQVQDMNFDFKADIVNEETQQVHYAQSTGLTHAINTNDYVGALSGESNVTPSGEFSYNIPILLGEATGNLKPNVALNYSSTIRNGHLGVGFNIAGLSAITRCEKNMETDGVASAVNLDINDRFCLDGQRLIIKNGQTYGANNTEYRTRQNNGYKIIAHTSNMAAGPYAFTVYDTEGKRYYYGQYSSATDGLIKASNGYGFSWALKRVEDASNNYYTYYYSKISGSLEHYPTAIKYSGHGGNTHNEIRFNWGSRNDTRHVTYLKGNKITLSKRLNRIDSFYSNQLLRTYHLTYGYKGTGVSQSVLEKIQTCGNNRCLSPTIFNWTNRGNVTLGNRIDNTYSRNSRYKSHQFLDFNGDGLTDIAYVRNDRGSSSDHLYMIPNTGRNFGQERRFYDLATSSFRKTWKVIDYDKDGKDDILYMSSSNSKWRVFKHTSGMNFITQTLSNISTPSSDNNTRFFDIDADGYPELLHFVGNRLSYQQGTKHGLASGNGKAITFKLNTNTNQSATLLAYDKEDNTFQAMDFNGDGRADFLAKVRIATSSEPPDFPCDPRRYKRGCDIPLHSVDTLESADHITTRNTQNPSDELRAVNTNQLKPIKASQLNVVNMIAETTYSPTNYQQHTNENSSYTYWKVLIANGLNNNDQFEYHEYLTVANASSIKNIQTVELNGDGLADLLYQNYNDKWYVRINNGNGFNSAIYLFTYDKNYLKTADINGDGISEIYQQRSGSYGGDYFYFFTGTSFIAKRLTSQSSDYHFTNFMDVTGDGTPDKLVFQGRMSLYPNMDAAATLITKITDGFGAVTSINYSTLNNRHIYTPHNDARHKNWGNGRVIDIKSGSRVVTGLRKGGDFISYRYHGAKTQVGRGILGFRQIEIESLNAATKVISTYRQDTDYRGSAEIVQSYVQYGNDNTNDDGDDDDLPPDFCDIEPQLCDCDWNDRSCELPYSSQQSTSVQLLTATASTADSAVWRLQTEVITNYARKQETSFNTANQTKPYLIYPQTSVTRNYNTDDSNGTVIATKTNTLTIDGFGNPLQEIRIIDSNNGYAYNKITNSYSYGNSYSNYGGRLTQKVEYKRYQNRSEGINKDNYTNSHISKFYYDSKGRLNKTIADNGVIKRYQLNAYGLIDKETVSVTGLPTKVLNTYYDSRYRHVTGEQNSLGHRSTIVYDSYGRKKYTQTANGQRTYYTYNQLGRLTGEIATPANNHSTSGSQALTSSETKYWCAGTTHCPSQGVYYQETITEGAPASRRYFDVHGRQLRQASIAFNGQYAYIDYQYDNKGRKSKESMPYFAGETPLWNAYQYDKQNRVIKIIKADQSIWLTEYNGQSTTSINPAGHRHTQINNALGLLVKVIDVNNRSASYQYDENGQSRRLTDPNGNQIQVFFDKYGNKTQEIDPDKGTVNYSYNHYGQLTQESDSNNNLITYQYDVLGRVTETIRQRQGKIEHHSVNRYDSGSYAKGMLYETKDQISHYTERFYFDAFGRHREKHTVIDGDTYKEQWTYNNNGQLATETDATGYSISRQYNSYHHLLSLKDHQTNQTLWQAKATDALGNITTEQLGHQINRHKTFDHSTGLLTSLRATGNGTLQQLNYDWSDLGNLNYRQDLILNKKETFIYDNLNRVTRSTIAGVAYTDIHYNDLGNITYKTGVGNYHYQSSRPHAVTKVTGTRANQYTYDAAGNMIKDNHRELSYNSFHKPTMVSKGDYWIEFAYSGAGKRYKRSEFGGEKGRLVPILYGDISLFIPLAQETRYVGNVEFIRYGGQSLWVSKRYIAGKVLITTVDNQATTRYILDDHLGSTHVIADVNGNLEQSMSFDVFGARRDAKTWARDFSDQAKFTSQITLRGYTGHEQMDEVGLIHMGGRIYDPILGRFMQADPMVQAPENIQNLNRYSYVVNNPLNKTDPSGYIFATIAVWAFNTFATKAFLTTTLGSILQIAFTAYQYYGYAKLGIGIVQAVNSGGTAMANFIGGYVKSWASGKAITCLLNAAAGLGCMPSPQQQQTKKQGNKETDGGNYKTTATSEDDALASGCSYESASVCGNAGRYKRISKDVGLIDGYDIDGLNDIVFVNNDTGFKSALFIDTIEGGFLVAFAGTDSMNDIDDIVGHFFGVETSQHREAASVATKVSAVVKGRLSFTGHSLGGALATTATIATGLTSTTFNAQGFNFGRMSQTKINKVNSLITAYKSDMDLLSLFQDFTPLTPNAAGNHISLGNAGFHGIGAICESLGTNCDFN